MRSEREASSSDDNCFHLLNVTRNILIHIITSCSYCIMLHNNKAEITFSNRNERIASVLDKKITQAKFSYL